LFYLGEYFHLFFFSLVISLFFFGGWESPFVIFFIVPSYAVPVLCS
jgi:NADH:ubiquinone oxidoreductase subunit H